MKRAGKRGENKWQSIPFDQAISEIVNGGVLFGNVPGEENRQVTGLKDLYALKDLKVFEEMAKDVAALRKKKTAEEKNKAIAEFKVKHMMITNVKGRFSGVSGTLSLDEQDVTNSKVEVTIPVATIDTREPDRDTHLKSADFFDVEKFPTLSFKSTSVVRRPDDELEIEGDLTIHGVTRKVRLAVEGPTTEGKDPWGNIRIGASAITKINRKDYGLVWNAALETGGILVGEDVAISIALNSSSRSSLHAASIG
jgi:polyisoprenoid-binding protein YceI